MSTSPKKVQASASSDLYKSIVGLFEIDLLTTSQLTDPRSFNIASSILSTTPYARKVILVRDLSLAYRMLRSPTTIPPLSLLQYARDVGREWLIDAEPYLQNFIEIRLKDLENTQPSSPAQSNATFIIHESMLCELPGYSDILSRLRDFFSIRFEQELTQEAIRECASDLAKMFPSYRVKRTDYPLDEFIHSLYENNHEQNADQLQAMFEQILQGGHTSENQPLFDLLPQYREVCLIQMASRAHLIQMITTRYTHGEKVLRDFEALCLEESPIESCFKKFLAETSENKSHVTVRKLKGKLLPKDTEPTVEIAQTNSIQLSFAKLERTEPDAKLMLGICTHNQQIHRGRRLAALSEKAAESVYANRSYYICSGYDPNLVLSPKQESYAPYRSITWSLGQRWMTWSESLLDSNAKIYEREELTAKGYSESLALVRKIYGSDSTFRDSTDKLAHRQVHRIVTQILMETPASICSQMDISRLEAKFIESLLPDWSRHAALVLKSREEHTVQKPKSIKSAAKELAEQYVSDAQIKILLDSTETMIKQLSTLHHRLHESRKTDGGNATAFNQAGNFFMEHLVARVIQLLPAEHHKSSTAKELKKFKNAAKKNLVPAQEENLEVEFTDLESWKPSYDTAVIETISACKRPATSWLPSYETLDELADILIEKIYPLSERYTVNDMLAICVLMRVSFQQQIKVLNDIVQQRCLNEFLQKTVASLLEKILCRSKQDKHDSSFKDMIDSMTEFLLSETAEVDVQVNHVAPTTQLDFGYPGDTERFKYFYQAINSKFAFRTRRIQATEADLTPTSSEESDHESSASASRSSSSEEPVVVSPASLSADVSPLVPKRNPDGGATPRSSNVQSAPVIPVVTPDTDLLQDLRKIQTGAVSASCYTDIRRFRRAQPKSPPKQAPTEATASSVGMFKSPPETRVVPKRSLFPSLGDDAEQKESSIVKQVTPQATSSQDGMYKLPAKSDDESEEQNSRELEFF